LKGFAGVDLEYETPSKPELVVDLTQMTVPEIVHGEFSNDTCMWISNQPAHSCLFPVSSAIILTLETQSLV
jgi:hypothetical protein